MTMEHIFLIVLQGNMILNLKKCTVTKNTSYCKTETIGGIFHVKKLHTRPIVYSCR